MHLPIASNHRSRDHERKQTCRNIPFRKAFWGPNVVAFPQRLALPELAARFVLTPLVAMKMKNKKLN